MAEEYQTPSKREDEGLDSDEFFENPTNRTVGAVILIVLGVLFLFSQMNVLDLTGNWWAIFIAVPAVMMLYNAYMAYNRAGGITQEVRKNVSGGAMVGTTAIVAATGRWDTLWPLFLIVLGVLALAGFTGSGKRGLGS